MRVVKAKLKFPLSAKLKFPVSAKLKFPLFTKNDTEQIRKANLGG